MNETTEMLAVKKYTLDDLVSEVNGIQDRCLDWTVENVSNKNMWYNHDSNKLVFSCEGERHNLSLTPFSLGQLCVKMGVPSRYVKKCLESGYGDLAGDNLNAWIDDYGKNLFIRQYDNSVRGILSDRYAVMDAPDVCEVITDCFDSGYNLRGTYISPERFHIRLIQNDMMKVKGEDLFAGICIDSSDVGRSVLCVQFLVWKQVCTNGLMLPKSEGVLFTQRHMGLTQKEFRNELTDNLKRIPELVKSTKESILNLRDTSDLVSYSMWEEEKQNAFVNRIRSLTRMNDDDIMSAVSVMENTYVVNVWGFVNALTQVAQKYTLERRLEIEKFAGSLLFDSRVLRV